MVNSYTTASLVEAETRATTSFSTSTTPTLKQVNDWIEEESTIIEQRTNMVFSVNTDSSVLVDYDGSGTLRFPKQPLVSITSVEYNVNSLGVAASWITLEEGYDKNYITYNDEAEIVFISGTNATNKVTPKAGNQRFRLTYNYGYEETPLEIQRLCTLAVSKRVVNSLMFSQSNTEGGTIQVGTIRISDPSNFGQGWFNSVNNEIAQLYNDIGKGFKTFRTSRYYV